MAAHGVLDRTTRDLDYFGGPDQAEAVHRLADALEQAVKTQGFEIRRDRQWEAFVRFRVSDAQTSARLTSGSTIARSTSSGPATHRRWSYASLAPTRCW